ncbi:MAG: acyl--CoA ligase, partial [Deltaproteobacteria bacterium]|nr:acyl--CoA ligase [Deltaproteobacteria bacterium]
TGKGGEVCVRGEAVFSGYWGESSPDESIIRDGWLHTGDLGSVDEDRHLYISGRIRAMIKRAGAMIPARAVEEVVDALANVKLSAAIGWTGGADTEDVVVVAEVRGAVLESKKRSTGLCRTIEKAVEEALGFPPRDVVLVPPGTVPRTANGKLRHGVLRDLYGSGELAPGAATQASRKRVSH